MLCFALATITSCTLDEEELVAQDTESAVDQGFTYTKLGKKKQIPCSVENMQRAYDAIRNNPTASQHPGDSYLEDSGTTTHSSGGAYQVNTTHYYVKFAPVDSLQYVTIARDSILAISDVPFEYELEVEGDIYQHPDYEGQDFTYYYSVVDINYDLPNNVPHTIVSNLHFTAEDEIPENASETDLQLVDFYHDLNMEALFESGNLEEEEQEELLYFFHQPDGSIDQLTWDQAVAQNLPLSELIINFNDEDYLEVDFFKRRRKWNPHGVIHEFEDAINRDIGLFFARVNVRKWGWLVIRNARTDGNGYFVTGHTRTKRVKYTVLFEWWPVFTVCQRFYWVQAKYRSSETHTRRGFFRRLWTGNHQFWSHVHNAAMDYYVRAVPLHGLHSPGYFMTIVANASRPGPGSRHFPPWIPHHPDIRVSKWDDWEYRGSDGVYGTTVHELTHRGHRNLDPGMFNVFSSGSCDRTLIKESWAEGVETFLVNERFDFLSGGTYGSSRIRDNGASYNFFRQLQSPQAMNEYTPLVDDLIDNFNQNTIPISPAPPVEQVSGYTLRQIQQALNHTRHFSQWETNLRNYFVNPTEHNLPQIFGYVGIARYNKQTCD